MQGNGPLRTIKVALVLYGGVSLAIYENGITRCFYDLVRKKGVFDPLLELLGARAEVDVVAGTSAGGINGLLLAATLESGTDFEKTHEVWRRLGDLGDLFREANQKPPARSLLDGEGYYLENLVEAFKDLCRLPAADYESPGEMDIFITGTELKGQTVKYTDELGHEIRDKVHRAVFHLRHRPGRRSLGFPKQKRTEEDADRQAVILASLARITSCFPAAFPPFQVAELAPEQREYVQAALESAATRELVGAREFIDGGVLDNKPFGPALNAVFYRMPTGLVDRRLFYVEPDPEPFADVNEGDKQGAPSTPLSVALDAVTRIPGHEGITEDLERLKEHNAKIAFVSAVKDELLYSLAVPPRDTDAMASEGTSREIYRRTRLESLARLLIADGDQVPKAKDCPLDAGRRAILDAVSGELATWDLPRLDSYDIDFLRRQAFQLLYHYYDELESDEPRDTTLGLVHALGQTIKTLRLIRSLLIHLRDREVAQVLEVTHKASGLGMAFDQSAISEAVGPLLQAFYRFLAADAPHWQELRGALERAPDLNAPTDPEAGMVPASLLTRVGDRAWEALDNLPTVVGDITILNVIAESLRNCVGGHEIVTDTPFQQFADIDRMMYPLMFVGGVHELDIIEFVRMSPADAQRGFSKRPAHKKVAGDQLAHFAAFLRRDWRSNDILWGRLDGICQLVESLLDGKTMHRLRRVFKNGRVTLDAGHFIEALPNCPKKARDDLAESLDGLKAAWDEMADPAKPAQSVLTAEQTFRDALILAAQEQAVAEELGDVFEDLHYQEIVWGRSSPQGTTSGASRALIESVARREGEAALMASSCGSGTGVATKGHLFAAQGLGAQRVVDAVPHHVIGEYVTQAYLLLWEMLGESLNKSKRFLENRRVRSFFRLPILFANRLLRLIRNETRTATLVAAAVTGVLVASTIVAFVVGQIGYGIVAFLGLVLFMWIFVRIAVGNTRRRLWGAVIAALFASALFVGGGVAAFQWAKEAIHFEVGQSTFTVQIK